MPWVALVYRMPPEPSGPRVGVWRELKALGGAYLQDGVYVLPGSPYHEGALQHLAHDIRNFGGTALLLYVSRADDERSLARLIGARRKSKTGGREGRRPAGTRRRPR